MPRTTTDNAPVSLLLRTALAREGHTATALGETAGYSRSAAARWISGESTPPIDALEAAADLTYVPTLLFTHAARNPDSAYDPFDRRWISAWLADIDGDEQAIFELAEPIPVVGGMEERPDPAPSTWRLPLPDGSIGDVTVDDLIAAWMLHMAGDPRAKLAHLYGLADDTTQVEP